MSKNNKWKFIGDLKECPFCGHDVYYTKSQYRGVAYYKERFDGDDICNAEMYVGAVHETPSKFAYCEECHKRIGRSNDYKD